MMPSLTPPAPSRLDRHLVLALLLVALAVIPRSLLIARSHSETIDAEYHIVRGLAYWTGTIAEQDLSLNDPPLGEALVSLPILVTNLSKGAIRPTPGSTTSPAGRSGSRFAALSGIRCCSCRWWPRFSSGVASSTACERPGSRAACLRSSRTSLRICR